jgi:hypothetical protein
MFDHFIQVTQIPIIHYCQLHNNGYYNFNQHVQILIQNICYFSDFYRPHLQQFNSKQKQLNVSTNTVMYTHHSNDICTICSYLFKVFFIIKHVQISTHILIPLCLNFTGSYPKSMVNDVCPLQPTNSRW